MSVITFIHKLGWAILKRTAFCFSDELFIKLKFRLVKGYWLNLNNPQTFCEKLQWLKLNNKRKDFTIMVDKIDAKKYVSSIIGEEYIIPTLGVYNTFEDIDFDLLPNQFIVKCSHNSSGGVICKDKTNFDTSLVKKHIEKYINKTYFTKNREYPYKDVPHRIIIEKFLTNGADNELNDYKFYCFNGRAEYCQLIANRSTKETIDFYNRNWEHQEFIGLNAKAVFADKEVERPENYSEMLDIADKIAHTINTPFVRIDLYNANKRIYFGEITFFPLSGFGSFRPKVWDNKLGELIKLP